MIDEFERYLRWHAWVHSRRRRIMAWSLEIGLPLVLLGLAIATWKGW